MWVSLTMQTSRCWLKWQFAEADKLINSCPLSRLRMSLLYSQMVSVCGEKDFPDQEVWEQFSSVAASTLSLLKSSG